MAKTDRKGIKNYSTQISVEKTISEIEKLLSKYNVKQLLKEYDEHGIASLTFSINYKDKIIPIRLPSRTDKIIQCLNGQVHKGNIPKKYKNNIEQARRVTWRIILDWIDAQMTMVDLGQKETIEIFLADIIDLNTKETFFQSLSNKKEFLLGYKNDLPE